MPAVLTTARFNQYPSAMVLFPNAKINLGLDILSVRPDGYHEIETLMVPIGWCDILEIVPSKNVVTRLTLSGRRVDCAPEKNLVMKAYNAFAELHPIPPVDIYLRKIIPDGAGLGGGSSDAAFTLIGLNSMFSVGLDRRGLCSIASSIGADCPFFVYNRPMIASGIGTDLAPAPPLEFDGWIVVAKPSDSVSTAEAYRNVALSRPETSLSTRLRAGITSWAALPIVNSFEKCVANHVPDVAAIKTRLYENGAVYASMSGSGSAVYGLFHDDKMAESAYQLLKQEFCSYFGKLMF